MEVKSKKKHAKDFKDQVVALVEKGKPPAEIAEGMEASRDLAYAWKSRDWVFEIGESGRAASSLTFFHLKNQQSEFRNRQSDRVTAGF